MLRKSMTNWHKQIRIGIEDIITIILFLSLVLPNSLDWWIK